MDIKDIVKGKAEISGVYTNGTVVYILTSLSGKKYQLEIDLSNKKDVGENAFFAANYVGKTTLMRWIRRAIENGTLIEIPQAEENGSK